MNSKFYLSHAESLSRQGLWWMNVMLTIHVKSALTKFQRIQAIRDRAIVMLIALAGLEPDEVCNLNKSDISISEKKIYICRDGKSVILQMRPALYTALQEWLSCNLVQNALFTTKFGKRIGQNCIRNAILSVDHRYLPNITVSILQNSFKNLILEKTGELC